MLQLIPVDACTVHCEQSHERDSQESDPNEAGARQGHEAKRRAGPVSLKNGADGGSVLCVTQLRLDRNHARSYGAQVAGDDRVQCCRPHCSFARTPLFNTPNAWRPNYCSRIVCVCVCVCASPCPVRTPDTDKRYTESTPIWIPACLNTGANVDVVTLTSCFSLPPSSADPIASSCLLLAVCVCVHLRTSVKTPQP